MVIQRTIENLRERPHDERRAVALIASIGVMAVLFIIWAVFFFQSINTAAVEQAADAYNSAVAGAQEAVSQTGWVSEDTSDTEAYTPIMQESDSEMPEESIYIE